MSGVYTTRLYMYHSLLRLPSVSQMRHIHQEPQSGPRTLGQFLVTFEDPETYSSSSTSACPGLERRRLDHNEPPNYHDLVNRLAGFPLVHVDIYVPPTATYLQYRVIGLTPMVVGLSQSLAQQSGTVSRISSGTCQSALTLSDVY